MEWGLQTAVGPKIIKRGASWLGFKQKGADSLCWALGQSGVGGETRISKALTGLKDSSEVNTHLKLILSGLHLLQNDLER